MKYGPGSILFLLALSHMRDHSDAAWLDSATDKDSAFYLGMLPERRLVTNLLIGTGGAADRALVSAMPTLTSLVAVQRQARRWLLDKKSATAGKA